MPTDISWLIGGPQGSGVESAANIFSYACAKMGYRIFGKREFYSNIKGEHSYFAVRVAEKDIRSNVNAADLMISYDAETILRHAGEVAPGGEILYDVELASVSVDEVRTLDPPFRYRLDAHLESLCRPKTVLGTLEAAEARGVVLYPVSFNSILSQLADEADNPRLKGMKRLFNVIGVSLSMGALGVSLESLTGSVGSIFSKKPKVAELNIKAARIAYERGAALSASGPKLAGTEKVPGMLLVQGFHGTAIGKMVSGCRYQPYYPITPASDESVFLESNNIMHVTGEDPGSTLIVQSEDEISAIGMAIGGSLTGARTATSTSGPGFSLMAEMLGWAGINEVPVVVTNYQRSGPSTGLPTRHGQEDLLFAINAGHGEFPRIVYASGDVEESFYDTCRCFNLAEIYQLPVIHMMDKHQASSVTTCPRFDPGKVEIARGKLLERVEGDYKRFALTPDGISPRSRLGLEDGIFWNTGDERDELGHISEDPVTRVSMMDKRQGKMERILDEVPDEDQAVSFGVYDTTIVGWGSVKGPVLDALDMLKAEDVEVGFVQVKMLHPFPADYMRSLLHDARRIIDVESNYTAQLGQLLRQHLLKEPDYYILKYTGRAMTCTEVYDSIKRILGGGAKKREVLTHGA